MHRYKQDEDEKPEDILRNSAKRIEREHPLDIVREIPVKKESKLVSFVKDKLDRLKSIKDKYQDNSIGKKERKAIAEEGHSERALKEFLGYYDGLYQEKDPDLEYFIKLVKRNGSPDVPNPYTQDSEEYFKYNTYSIMGADLEYILESIIKELKEGEQFIYDNESFYEEAQNDSSKKTITLLKAMEKNNNDENIRAKRLFENALQAWAVIIVYGTGCEYLRRNIDESNIKVATVETILSVNAAEIGLTVEQIAENAAKYNFINQGLANALLKQRQEMIELS